VIDLVVAGDCCLAWRLGKKKHIDGKSPKWKSETTYPRYNVSAGFSANGLNDLSWLVK